MRTPGWLSRPLLAPFISGRTAAQITWSHGTHVDAALVRLPPGPPASCFALRRSRACAQPAMVPATAIPQPLSYASPSLPCLCPASGASSSRHRPKTPCRARTRTGAQLSAVAAGYRHWCEPDGRVCFSARVGNSAQPNHRSGFRASRNVHRARWCAWNCG